MRLPVLAGHRARDLGERASPQVRRQKCTFAPTQQGAPRPLATCCAGDPKRTRARYCPVHATGALWRPQPLRHRDVLEMWADHCVRRVYVNGGWTIPGCPAARRMTTATFFSMIRWTPPKPFRMIVIGRWTIGISRAILASSLILRL